MRIPWIVIVALGASGLACNNNHGDGDVFNDGGSTAMGDDTNSSPPTTGVDDGVDSTGVGTSMGLPKLDVGSDTDSDLGCGCALDYIWIANSEQGTVSKVDTTSLMEEGRYITRPDGVGNPSRTSVNLAGDVAVANRHGGLVKIYADPAKCLDTNGTAGIQTSTDSTFLPWGEEECVAWYTQFPVTNQRPVAWTPGSVTPGTCDSTGEMVWTVASATPGLGPGIGGAGGVIAYLVDGDDGSIAQEIAIDAFSGFQLGAYGGAVNADGDLFFTPMGGITFGGQLARVELATGDVTLWDLPAGLGTYGITVDHAGRVWVSSILGAGAGRFDPGTGQWDIVNGWISAGGLAEDANGLMWVATDTGANSIDADTLALGPVFAAMGGGTVKGISVDVDGFVWAVNEIAWKIDPDTGASVGNYAGLASPYTYSDMTGFALGNVVCPPAG